MEQREMKGGWWVRYVLFLIVSFGILGLHLYLNPPKPPRPRPQEQLVQQGGEETAPVGERSEQDGAEEGPGEAKPPATEQPAEAEPAPDQPAPSKPESPGDEPEGPGAPAALPKPAPKPALVTLGSLDPESPFQELVTLTNLGAAVVRIELNSPRFHDLEDRSGYLGHPALDEILNQNDRLAPEERERRVGLLGCLVDAVGPGTPAAQAGLEPGDLVTSVNGHRVTGFRTLRQALRETRPNDSVELTILRDDEPLTVSATLGQRPLEVVRPENGDPLSFLLTLARIDQRLLEDVVKASSKGDADDEEEQGRRGDKPRDEKIGLELPGLDLRIGAWQIEDKEKFERPGPHTSVTFFRELPRYGLKISKSFRLAQVPEGASDDEDPKAYHLELEVKVENVGNEPRQVAYQLDGPTGLPVEGKWYAYKVGRGGGLRDVVVSWEREAPSLVPCRTIANDEMEVWGEQSMTYVGVDAQYFSAVMIPQKEDPEEIWFARSQPLRVGAVDENWEKTTNTSCRVTSIVHKLEPGQKLPEHVYTVFAGPKKPPLLAKYGLKDIVYYGWFWWVAVPMLWTLHFFYAIVGNYGLAIIMLTVLVRGCMFPLSIKQQRGAQKMQELQPKIKEIHEKYKNNA
jgi:YidC/Oxa1 family membrane protein insertase